MKINLTKQDGIVLKTAGKLCEEDIIVVPDESILGSGESSGSTDSGGQYLVRVIDYDGTVLKQDHLDEGATFELPDSPTHERLTFQGWSSPVDIADNVVTVGNSDITIGAMYETVSGASEFDIKLTKTTGLAVTLLNLTGMTSIDWGDGTTDSTLTHTYTNYGEYTIKVYGVTAFGDETIANTGSTNWEFICTKIFLGNTVTSLGRVSFTAFASLSSVTIPNSVTSIAGDYAGGTFMNCSSLKSITIPNSVTSLGGNFCSSNYMLTSVVIPNSITSIGQRAFEECYVLFSITIPNSVTSIDKYAFYSCCGLTSITVPSGVTTINDYTFASSPSRNVRYYDFTQATAVPTLSNKNAFYIDTNFLSKIVVPDSLYDSWIAATNWSTYADYIYKASEVDGSGEAESGESESTGFQVTMSTGGGGYNATVYDGTDTSGTGVTITSTPTVVTCTSGYLTLSVGSSYYVGTSTEVGTITGDIQGSIITLSGSGYNGYGIQYTVASDGSILDIPIYID